jgi:hypothetical protein
MTAEAGGGKSTVMRALVDQLVDSPDAPMVAYFFFQCNDELLSSYPGALSCVIFQLLAQETDTGYLSHVQELCEQTGFRVKHSTRLMWYILAMIARHTKRDIYCFFDALEECNSTERPQLMEEMKAFITKLGHEHTQVKLVASSRSDQNKDQPYSAVFSTESSRVLRLQGEMANVQPDIHNVILSMANNLATERKLGLDIQNLLIEQLLKRNHDTRSFLAIQMEFELLGSDRRMNNNASVRTIRMILNDIPDKLDKKFDQMLNRSRDLGHAKRLLCTVLAARRALYLDESKLIYSMTESTDRTFHPTSYNDLELQEDNDCFKQLVRDRCGLFITFVEDSVHFFHQMAREYLLNTITETSTTLPRLSVPTSASSNSSSWKHSISHQEANYAILEICLDVLAFPLAENSAVNL